jgi:hypothetical protein
MIGYRPQRIGQNARAARCAQTAVAHCAPKSQVRWRAENLDRVPRCGVAECGRIDRAGVRQAALGGGLADLGREVFEAGWRRQLQDSKRFGTTHDEGVRQPHRQYDEIARSGGKNLAVGSAMR